MKILGIGSSIRTGSFSEQVLHAGLEMARDLGAEATAFDFRANALPLYNGDEEAVALPESVLALKKAISEADAVVICLAEYNASLTPLLKNAIDWASRGTHGSTNVWDRKPVALLSSSPGPLGGIRALISVRPIMQNVMAHVIADQAAVGSSHEAFNEDGSLKDARTAGFMKSTIENLILTTKKLKG